VRLARCLVHREDESVYEDDDVILRYYIWKYALLHKLVKLKEKIDSDNFLVKTPPWALREISVELHNRIEDNRPWFVNT
jgi:hypothetical protein